MTSESRENPLKAMHNEAFTHMKYTLLAQQARQDGREQLATYFEKTAETEGVDHFAEEGEHAWMVRNDRENGHNAMHRESY